jgi:hypothetical protein
VSLEEHARLQEERKQCMEQALEEPVAVREGDVKWIDELYNVLIGSGIPCRVHFDPGCKKGCGGNTCRLLVSGRDGARAHERVEEYFTEIHPEARASQELVSQGKCPACGHAVGPRELECPDCGLTLLLVIE